MFDGTPSRADLIRSALPQVRAGFKVGGGCGIRTREGVNPTRFPSLPSASPQCSHHTARRRSQAWQPIMNPAERSRMRLKLRLGWVELA
jgi:hypothetical protein